MPKVVASKKKSRFTPISLVDTLERDLKVTPKHRKRSKSTNAGQDEDEEEINLAAVEEDKAAAKLEKLSRDLLELEDDLPDLPGLREDNAAESHVLEDDLRAYPFGESILASAMCAEGDEQNPPRSFGKTLGDLIFEKMQEKTRKEAEAEKMALFTTETIELFQQVGTYMAKYRSGKLPKALRFIPNLRNWLDVLWLTKPENWTPHAVAAATPMFIGNTTDSQARSFMTHVLLPAVHSDLSKSPNEAAARLNVHLYEALCRCLRRPSLFFKAIYFPVILAEDSGCTYRQAVLLSSVISRESFPGLQAAAAIIKLCQHQPQSNQIYYCILRLLNKKHDLPRPAIHIIAAYFLATMHRKADDSSDQKLCRQSVISSKSTKTNKGSSMPVIWHQALLVFIQRWSALLSDDQKSSFKKLFKTHYHPKITDECRRQLFDNDSSKIGVVADMAD